MEAVEQQQFLTTKIGWIKNSAKGMYCVAGDFYLDPTKSVHRAVISHAHADHYRRGHKEVHATSMTIQLARARYREKAGATRVSHEFGESFSLGKAQVTLLPAHHMAGSAMILIEHQGESVLYTGDYNPDQKQIEEFAEQYATKIDLLISECTFSHKARHDDPEEALRAVVKDADERPLLIGAYALGKAQRINQMLSQNYPDLDVYIHKNILPFHKTYQALGEDPGRYRPFRRRQAWRSKSFAYIVPPKILSGYADIHGYYKVMASGWDYRDKWHFIDGWLDISDHVDADRLISFVNRLEPKELMLIHGAPEPLLPVFAESRQRVVKFS